MSRSAVALLVSGLAVVAAPVGLAGCHLADSADPVKCDPGSHPTNGYCVLDAVTAVSVTISPGAGGAPCTVSPDSITVAPSAQFEFKNEDSVEHLIAGVDGVAWATAKPGQLSPLIGITKVGTWAYTVSGCAAGGTVVVE